MMLKKTIKVLLIEDNEGDARLIQAYLSETANITIELERADCLSAGLGCLADGGLDVVLLDLVLPDSSGLETFRKVIEHDPDAAVVVLTGLDVDELALRAVQEGAEDYLVKNELDADRLIRSVRYAVERTERRRVQRALELTQQELRVAWKIQHSLYPDSSPVLDGIHISGASYPAAEVGGDFYDYIPMLNDDLGIVIADASGHGIDPALLMAEARATLRTLARSHGSVEEIVTAANRILMESMLDNHFITLFMAGFNPRTRSMVFANAGHPPGYIFDPSGEVVMELDSTDFPIGIVPDCDYTSSDPVTLEPGQIVVLLSDGVLEAGIPGHKPFGVERIKALVRDQRYLSGSQIVDTIYNQVLDHCKPDKPKDDMTLIVIKVDANGS